jgi:hypothetical protein
MIHTAMGVEDAELFVIMKMGGKTPSLPPLPKRGILLFGEKEFGEIFGKIGVLKDGPLRKTKYQMTTFNVQKRKG